MDAHTAHTAQNHSAHTSSAHNNTLLMIWDAPNLDMGLGSILGGRPTANSRPRFDAIGRWILEISEEETSPQKPACSPMSHPAARRSVAHG